MSFYQIRLAAGQPFTQNTAGTLLLIDSLGAASGVDVKLTSAGGSDGATMPNRQTAFRLVEPFSAATFTAAVDTTIGVFLSNSDVQLGITAGSGVTIPGGVAITNTPDARVPVDVGGAQINVNAVNVGINNNDAAAVPTRRQALAALVDMPAVAVGAAATVAANDNTLKRLIFRNADAAAVIALGGAGVSLANSAIQIQPGGVYVEEAAAAAKWYAVSTIAGASLQVQGMK